MSKILKVSVPTGGLENTTRTNPINVNDVNISNVVDPSKVVRPDGQRPNPDKNLGTNYESNFQSFLEALRNRPDLVESFTQIFFQMGSMVSSGIGEDFAAEIAKFLEMTKMTPEDMVQFLKEQGAQNSKFSSDVFQTLRDALDSTKSVELKTAILTFMKTFNDASASRNTLNNIISVLKSMSRYMPQSYRQGLMEAAESLKQGGGQEAMDANISALDRKSTRLNSSHS